MGIFNGPNSPFRNTNGLTAGMEVSIPANYGGRATFLRYILDLINPDNVYNPSFPQYQNVYPGTNWGQHVMLGSPPFVAAPYAQPVMAAADMTTGGTASIINVKGTQVWA